MEVKGSGGKDRPKRKRIKGVKLAELKDVSFQGRERRDMDRNDREAIVHRGK